jgi:hypothetical protein
MNDWPCEYWTAGALLMHQQCWQFGRDVVAPQGNVLLAEGFERERPPEGQPASSRYWRMRPGEPALCLWAFGALAYVPGGGGIYINRYQFVPRWVPEPEVAAGSWKAAVFDGCAPAVTFKTIRESRRLLRFVMGTFAGYEESVLRRYGVDYRRETLRGWHLPSILPCRMPTEWRRLGWHVPEPPVGQMPAYQE